MTPVERAIRELVKALREEIASEQGIANTNRSRERSDQGDGSPGHGDQECNRESMDLTSTETDGESTSLSAIEESARRDVRALLHGSRQTPTSQPAETKRKVRR